MEALEDMSGAAKHDLQDMTCLLHMWTPSSCSYHSKMFIRTCQHPTTEGGRCSWTEAWCSASVWGFYRQSVASGRERHFFSGVATKLPLLLWISPAHVHEATVIKPSGLIKPQNKQNKKDSKARRDALVKIGPAGAWVRWGDGDGNPWSIFYTCMLLLDDWEGNPYQEGKLGKWNANMTCEYVKSQTISPHALNFN